MKKRHTLGASVLLGAAAVAGMLAVTRTIQLGQAASTPSTSSLGARAAALVRAETQIRRLDASVPPALPPRAPVAPGAAGEHVTYVRAPSIGGEDEWEDQNDDADEVDDRGHGGPDDDEWEPGDDD